jgi:hypothetical protein
MTTTARHVLNPTTGNPPRPRRRIPLSLRMFLLILLGLSTYGVWFAADRYRESKAVQRIISKGGFVDYGGLYDDNGRLKVAGTPRGPAWLRRIIGNNVLDTPTSVHFDGDTNSKRGADIVSADLVSDIVQLRSLKAVSISGIHLSEKDLECLCELKEVHSLFLGEKTLDDIDLDALKGLPLRWLALPRTRISDKGLLSLRDMDSLRYFDLTRTRISDKGIGALEGMSNLRTLSVRRTKVSREGATLLQSKLRDCNIEWEPPPAKSGGR